LLSVRIAVWSPLPPSPSGIADYVAESLPELARCGEVCAVVPRPQDVAPEIAAFVPLLSPSQADAELDIYHIGNSPAHAYVYRAALERPGIIVLHEWNLQHLILSETVERGDPSGYVHEMRSEYAELGTLVGRQIARALGGEMLPALFPLNERLLRASLAVVGLTDYVCSRVRRALPGVPVLHLPHHLALPLEPFPTRSEARRSLDLAEDAVIVTAPGLATAHKRWPSVLRVMGRLCPRYPRLRLVLAGGEDPALPLDAWSSQYGLGAAFHRAGRLDLSGFLAHLVAADVVLALRFPTYGEISGALVRALGIGRPALVSDGTPAAEEFPAGTVVPIDPGAYEEPELAGLLERLLTDAVLRERIGRIASEHVRREHDLARTVARLWSFTEEVLEAKPRLLDALERERLSEGGLLGFLVGELSWYARDLGLPTRPFLPLLADLVRDPS
jgi:glycosyltransferase involved in cell wall biosynthesis